MFYIKDTYAKVWKTMRTKEKFTDLKISTSEKDQDGNYKNYTWFIRCLGAAHNKAKKVGEGTRIKILKGKIINENRKDEDGNWLPYGSCITILVFDFEIMNDNNDDSEDEPKKTSKKKSSNKKESTKKKQEVDDEEEDDEDIDVPF